MPLCDTLLRSAEEPSFFRMAWSESILTEVRRGLEGPKFGYSREQVDRRIRAMNAAFPEALITFPLDLADSISGLPDPDDRHVVALAIHAQAHTIVTDNVRDFPVESLSRHNLTVNTADEFLVHQYHLNPQIMLEKLDRQAAGIRRQRAEILQLLQNSAPAFCKLCANPRQISPEIHRDRAPACRSASIRLVRMSLMRVRWPWPLARSQSST
jgi:predicted nucleic acid-binding protein